MDDQAHSYDVVVLGAGVAGLSAAVAAAGAGARVAVLERATPEESGGNTRYTEAFLRMKSVSEPADDFAERLLGDFMGYPDLGLLSDSMGPYDSWSPLLRAMNVADADLVEAFEQASGPTLQWLQGLGVAFGEVSTPFITTSTTRLAPVGGGLAMLEALHAVAAEREVDIHYTTTGRALVQDRDGAVVGVEATDGTGRWTTFRGQVVLANGGFEGNPEMLARYMGADAVRQRPIARGGYYNKGEGIDMGLSVGAATCGNFGMFHAEPMDPRSSMPEPAIFVFPYGILVNRQGQRFTDEAPGPVDAHYERVTRQIYEQERGIAWVILDAKLEDVPRRGAAIRTDQAPLVADTIEELAGVLELPPEPLVATVDAYNAACDDGPFDAERVDGLSTQGLVPRKSNWARPVDKPPFQAYPIICANVFTFGGLKVNAEARVVDQDGVAIRGLFAAGEVVGLYITNYTGSTSVLKGAVFGRIAGQLAAQGTT